MKRAGLSTHAHPNQKEKKAQAVPQVTIHQRGRQMYILVIVIGLYTF